MSPNPKAPPYSIEAEQSVLGGLMLDNRAWNDIAEQLSEVDFYRADHRVIWRAIADLNNSAQPCDFVTISEYLRSRNLVEDAGGISYLGSLANDTPSAANVMAYAEIVRERSVLRQLIGMGGDIAEMGYRPEGRNTATLIDEAEREVFKLRAGAKARSDFVDMPEVLKQVFSRIETVRQNPLGAAGLTTGFTEFDAKTTGLGAGDLMILAARPSMGKCLAEDSELVLDDGSIATIAELYRRRDARIGTLRADLKLDRAAPSDYVDDGEKPVFEVTTRLGRRVETTLTHPFLTIDGWKPLAALKPGDHVAVPRVLPVFGSEPMRECEVKLLAYLIGDGGLTGSSPRFTTTNLEIERDFHEAVAAFGGCVCTPYRSETRAASFAVVADHDAVVRQRSVFAGRLDAALSGAGRPARAVAAAMGVSPSSLTGWRHGTKVPDAVRLARLCTELRIEPATLPADGARHNAPNAITAWLRELGLDGCGAAQKQIPAPVFRLPRESLAQFLRHLFATDGWATVLASGQSQLGYASVSERLARQVAHLLLRFGIVAKVRLRWVRYRDTRRPSWQVDITDGRSIRHFIEEIGIFGKTAAVERVRAALAQRREQTNTDLIPKGVWRHLAKAKGDMSWAELARRAGVNDSNLHADRRALSRQRLARFAMVLGDTNLAVLANSDVYWDRVESIVPAGMRQVYDLTMPVTHNFVANDVCVHNTSLAVNIAEHVAFERKQPVAIFSMEMSAEQIGFRIISSRSGIPLQKLRSGNLNDTEMDALTWTVGRLREAPLYIDEQGGLSPQILRAKARRLAMRKPLALMVVDYIQLMSVPALAGKRVEEVSEISRQLKALAKELKIPIIALSQLNRGLENREDKRPRMADLRECVAGDTLVCLADGRRVPIRDLVGTTPEVWAIDEAQKIVKAQSECVWSVGEKPLFRVQLASGREMRVTAEHRLLSGTGWKRLSELAVGDRLALARTVPEPTASVEWSDSELVLLGHLIGDGSYPVHQPLRYTTASETNSAAVAKAATDLGSTVTRHEGRGNWHQLVIAGNGNRWHAAGVGAWLKRLDIFGQRSHQKRVPPAVFQLRNERIALLLRHLWATDGSIGLSNSKGPTASQLKGRIYFCTCSEGLARDVAALLLRLGIVARIGCSITQGHRPLYNVDVRGSEAQVRFLREVGAFGPREEPARRLGEHLVSVLPNTNVDTLPRETFVLVREQMRAQGITQRKMATLRGTSYGGNSHFKFEPSRKTLAGYAHILGDVNLAMWSESDLFWDRIVSIAPDGIEEVFDLTVPGPASWLADGIVSHNSGGIEQDADLVVFIYREWVYDKSKDESAAEIIIAKQRNGSLGNFPVQFIGANTKFDNPTGPGYGA